MSEQWRGVVGTEGLYEVSDLGNVRRVGAAKNLKLRSNPHRSGYLSACFWIKGRAWYPRINRLVLEAFVGPAEPGMQAAHYNGINTDNTLANLRWATAKENAADTTRLGRKYCGMRHANAKLTTEHVAEIRRRAIPRIKGVTNGNCGKLAAEFWVSVSQIHRIRNRQSRRDA
jgi:HNH endonuclease/NUMOD4 motif-containing protein